MVNAPDDKQFDEFALIAFLRDRLVSGVSQPPIRSSAGERLVVGIGDDAAVVEIPDGKQLVITTDTLVEGVHFEHGTRADDLGHKSLAVNLSDLAAMGACPSWYFLSLTLPAMERGWMERFCEGIGALSSGFGIGLAGGDVTCGPLSLTITACGTVENGTALKRGGARPGDHIAVSGNVGLSARALADLNAGKQPTQACRDALRRPTPRVLLGAQINGFATSCIDVSDGLFADLGHILASSGVGGVLYLDQLPRHPDLDDLEDEKRWNLQLGGGDDYELCFTFSPEDHARLEEAARASGTQVSGIGRIVTGAGCECIRADGSLFEPGTTGYVHGAIDD